MKKLLGIIVVILSFNTQSSAFEISMVFKTHLKCDMIKREYNPNNDLRIDKTHKIDELPDDQITIFIAFDENFVFYSWHKKKKNYEKKDKIIEYNELKIVTGQYSNFDVYLNTKEWLNDLSIERIPNPGSLRFIINREKGQLIRNVVWQWGGGYKDIFECKKINYFLLPKEKKEKINKKF